MLSDAKLLDLPNPFRYMLARWIIAPARYKKSTEHYGLIWDKEHNSSPLVFHAQNLCQKIERKSGFAVEYAFRYGHPNAKDAIQSLEKRVPEMKELIVMHLFPHFAQSSYQTAVDEVVKCYNSAPRKYSIRIVAPYYNHLAFIRALSERIQPYVVKDYDKLIFNYHSLPLKHLEREKSRGKEFDYIFQGKETLRLVSEHLKIDQTKNLVTYSSSIGKNWKEPFLEDVVEKLPSKGDKNLLVVCAGFPSDNLESLFDVGIEASEKFKANGGENLTLIPGLNSEDFWADAIIEMVNDPKS